MIAKCPCEHCGENIEFATEDFLPGGRVACPHCGVETAIYISSPSLISKSVAPASASPQNQPDAIKGRAWYYSQDGKRIGPCNESQIHTLIATHTIRLDSLVWCEGMSDWTAANRTDIRHFLDRKSTRLNSSHLGI